jgi:hypothetical protein
MGGPIVRTGTTPAFWTNWDQAFGKKNTAAKSASKPKAAKKVAKPAKKAAKKKK